MPIVKVGEDLHESADGFLATLNGLSSVDFVRPVPEANNRVSLFYHDRSRRCERLTGGVPGWRAAEIEKAALSCDALYVNFISGWELDLEAAAVVGDGFAGPAWCDVHSLILGVGDGGVREPRRLEDREAWLGAFDLLQVNEDELGILAPGDGTRQDQMRDLLSDGPEARVPDPRVGRGGVGRPRGYPLVARPERRGRLASGLIAGAVPVETHRSGGEHGSDRVRRRVGDQLFRFAAGGGADGRRGPHGQPSRRGDGGRARYGGTGPQADRSGPNGEHREVNEIE